MNAEKIVLVDADVISHFIAAGELLMLASILSPYKILIPDLVYVEVSRIKSRKPVLDNVINLVKSISVFPFPQDEEVLKEFALIKKLNPLIGDGERACMAIAKINKDVIASSNFRDIADYCENNNIPFLGTLDILHIALKRNIFDEMRCDNFIEITKQNNKAKYPNGIKRISDYFPSTVVGGFLG